MRTFAHVGKERLEGLPSLTYFDSAPAIVFVLLVLIVLASLVHSHPRNPSRRIAHTVRGKSGDSGFLHKASTASCGSRQNMGLARHLFGSAIAFEKPKRPPVSFAVLSDSDQATVPSPRNINRCLQAPACFGIPVTNVSTYDADGIPTVAAAYPFRVPIGIAAISTDHSEKSKSLLFHRQMVSRWAKQVGERAQRLAKQMKDG